jgi:ABC transporter substrate-binding protein PnrA-like
MAGSHEVRGSNPLGSTFGASFELEEGLDLILVQSNLVDVNAVASDFPETHYVTFDFTGRPRPSLPNVSYVSFAADQGSFLVGAAAALESHTGRIGFIGGVDVPVIHRFQAGYEAGARAVDPNNEVRSIYLTPSYDFSGFGSQTLGLHAAERLYRHGADVIYHAAGTRDLVRSKRPPRSETGTSGRSGWTSISTRRSRRSTPRTRHRRFTSRPGRPTSSPRW